MLRNSKGIVLALFSMHVGCLESNKAEAVAILEAIRIFTDPLFILDQWLRVILLMLYLGCTLRLCFLRNFSSI